MGERARYRRVAGVKPGPLSVLSVLNVTATPTIEAVGLVRTFRALVQEFGAQCAMLYLFLLTPILLLLSAFTPPASRRTTNHGSGRNGPSQMARGTMLSC